MFLLLYNVYIKLQVSAETVCAIVVQQDLRVKLKVGLSCHECDVVSVVPHGSTRQNFYNCETR